MRRNYKKELAELFHPKDGELAKSMVVANNMAVQFYVNMDGQVVCDVINEAQEELDKLRTKYASRLNLLLDLRAQLKGQGPLNEDTWRKLNFLEGYENANKH